MHIASTNWEMVSFHNWILNPTITNTNLFLDPQEPIPVWVKDIYAKTDKNHKKRENNYNDTKTTFMNEDRGLTFEESDEGDRSPNYVQPKISLNKGKI